MKTKRIVIDNQELLYTLRKNRRSRCIRLIIHSDRSITITAPLGVSELIIDRFVEEKSGWIVSKINSLKPVMPKEAKRREYLENKEKARRLITERIVALNGIYGFKFNKISIRNQKTCWGSCSKRGNLNFNYKIALLPERARDYVIVHELCHLAEFNHSPRFWDLVSRAFPDYKEIRADLRKHSVNLE